MKRPYDSMECGLAICPECFITFYADEETPVNDAQEPLCEECAAKLEAVLAEETI